VTCSGTPRHLARRGRSLGIEPANFLLLPDNRSLLPPELLPYIYVCLLKRVCLPPALQSTQRWICGLLCCVICRPASCGSAVHGHARWMHDAVCTYTCTSTVDPLELTYLTLTLSTALSHKHYQCKTHPLPIHLDIQHVNVDKLCTYWSRSL